MSILITGGAGYIGSHTVIELLNDNKEVIIVDNFFNSNPMVLDRIREISGKDFKFYEVDTTNREELEIVFKENKIDSEWLFPKKTAGKYVDEPIDKTTLDSWAETFSSLLGVDFYWHSLRHYFTTACSRSGLPDDVIQMLVGWQSLDMVSVYKDLTPDEQFEKYFVDGEIRKVEQASISDL